MIGHSASVEIGQLLELGGSNRAFNIRVEGSLCFDRDYLLLDSDVPPIKDYEEDENGDDDSNDELEEMIPYIIDVRSDFLSKLSTFISIISLEELNDVTISKRAVEFNGTIHSKANRKHTNNQTDCSQAKNYAFMKILADIRMRKEEKKKG